MKKNFMMGMFALAALAMTSCSMNDEISSAAKDQEVVFGTYVGRDAQTKAHVEDLTGLQGHGFGVYAYYTGQGGYNVSSSQLNFMNNQKVEWKGSAWGYSPLKYWPNNVGDKITFFAYAPYNAENVYKKPEQNHQGDPKLTFVVNSSVAAQEDLLFSRTNNLNMTKPGVDAKINFEFAHALSRIGFSAQTMIDKVNEDNTGGADANTANGTSLDGNTTVAIEKVELIGNFYHQGELNLDGGVWGNLESSSTTYTLGSAQFDSTVANGVKTDEKALNNEEGYIMIIPKNFTGSGSEAVQIRVTYTVTTTDANLYGGNSVIRNVITSSPFSFNFEQGQAYNFSLHLGLNSVQFSATVDNWDERPADTAVNVPLN